ncbi:sulfite reductase [NADPH [Halorhodospira halochloris]|uniref:Sulfite reductase [NADPH n=2 Tax=Halorhodospira halochloris TaxID=1052 RepID=A0A0X8XB37_HALHR|nr:nitrite/sulfite reductase [Halorhodospira halochloris]BAU56604.1 sulfite reductase [NADPH [Halorhodospira halochloris]
MSVLNASKRSLISENVAHFQQAISDYLSGELDQTEFTPLRLRNGLFFQNGESMLRIAIPDGVMSASQLRHLADLQRRFADGRGHFTTRQNIQLYQARLEQVPQLIGELAASGLYTMQTSGPCIRAVTIDPLAGLAAEEVTDPRPWSELLRHWATLHQGFANLPRKLKIAISTRADDRSALRAHDIGLRITGGSAEQSRFEIWIGGGLGRRPALAKLLYADIPGSELLLYLEAILRVYDRDGQRHDKQRARLKSFVEERGIANIRSAVAAELEAIAADEQALAELSIDASSYAAAVASLPGLNPRSGEYEVLTADLLDVWARADAEFGRWLLWNSQPQSREERRAVTVCLRGRGQAAGNITSAELEQLASLAQWVNGGELRCTQQQNILIPHVPLNRLYGLWQELRNAGLAEPIAGSPSCPLACPGKGACELANTATGAVTELIHERLSTSPAAKELGDTQLAISGCMNGCSHHAISEIGLRGVSKNGHDWFQFVIGGSPRGDLRLGQLLGPAVPQEQVPDVVEALAERYQELRLRPSESFSAVVARVGVKPFRSALHAQPKREILCDSNSYVISTKSFATT